MKTKLFHKYPFLFFVVAGIIIANHLFHFAPGPALRGNLIFIVPGILIALGTMGYVIKIREKNKEY